MDVNANSYIAMYWVDPIPYLKKSTMYARDWFRGLADWPQLRKIYRAYNKLPEGRVYSSASQFDPGNAVIWDLQTIGEPRVIVAKLDKEDDRKEYGEV
jgi:hypothetical protein